MAENKTDKRFLKTEEMVLNMGPQHPSTVSFKQSDVRRSELLTPSSVTPAVIYLSSENGPTGTILCAGAGVYSEAKIMESEVCTPCPISELGIINVVVPSGEILIQIPRSSEFSTFSAKPVFGSYANPTIKPV